MSFTEGAIEQVLVGTERIALWVPDAATVRRRYEALQHTPNPAPFPYWSKLWSSSIALSGFMLQNAAYVQGKSVLELAAGLGLPSLVAARFARRVLCTDFIAESVHYIERSAALNGLTNLEARVMDWKQVPAELKPDTVLLSDVNYEPADFESLFELLHRLLHSGCTALLATPQRLMAKPFIHRLLPFAVRQEESVAAGAPHTILVLRGGGAGI